MKAWKCTRALALHLNRLEEHVHEQGLAAPDGAPNVEAAKRFARARCKQPAECAGLFCGPIAVEPRGERVEPLHKLFLSGIALEPAAANQIPITYWQARHAIPKGRLAPLSVRLRSRKQNAALHTDVAAGSE